MLRTAAGTDSGTLACLDSEHFIYSKFQPPDTWYGFFVLAFNADGNPSKALGIWVRCIGNLDDMVKKRYCDLQAPSAGDIHIVSNQVLKTS
jgi:hypothetical protein